jgi:hypothetical protein
MAVYQINAMLRPRIDLDETTKDRVNRYAQAHGVRLPRAYAELIERGLDSEGFADESEAEA